MNRILSYILGAFLLGTVSLAQDSRTDSLLNLTSVRTGEELSRTFYELSLELLEINVDSALYFASQAELLLQKADPKNLLPLLYKSKGGIYESKMVPERSLFYYNKAYEDFIKLENHQEYTPLCAERRSPAFRGSW